MAISLWFNQGSNEVTSTNIKADIQTAMNTWLQDSMQMHLHMYTNPGEYGM